MNERFWCARLLGYITKVAVGYRVYERNFICLALGWIGISRMAFIRMRPKQERIQPVSLGKRFQYIWQSSLITGSLL